MADESGGGGRPDAAEGSTEQNDPGPSDEGRAPDDESSSGEAPSRRPFAPIEESPATPPAPSDETSATPSAGGEMAPGPSSSGPQPPYYGFPYPTQPASKQGGSRAAIVALVVAAVAAVGLVGVVGLILLNGASEEELEARGAPMENASAALREAEEMLDMLVSAAGSQGEVTTDGRVSCWFSYQEGGPDPDDYLRCGPLAFADSEPDTYWLRLPVSYREGEDGTRVVVGQVDSIRTVAVEPDEELRRHDGKKVPSPDQLDLERPPATPAEPGALGVLPASAVMVDLTEPDDGRLVGVGYRWEVLGSAATDRVRLLEERLGRTTVFSAPDGDHWLLFRVSRDQDMGMASLAETELDYTIVVDGDDHLSLNEIVDDATLLDDEAVFAVLVPEEADEVELAINDGLVEQSWSFTGQERSGDTPAVLYREAGSLTADIDQELVLPYGARDLNPIPGYPSLDLGDGTVLPGDPGLDLSRPFGDLELTLRFDEARLHYGVQTSPFENPRPHTASGPDRALLYLTTSELTWDEEIPYFGSMGTEGVLVLEDGTEIAATRLVETNDDLMNGGVQDLGSALEPGTSVFDGLVWDVPADIESATVKITFRSINDGDFWELDFQDAVVELEMDFTGS